MHDAGYVTGITGKWHEGTMPGYWPTDRGFDEFYGFLGGAHHYVNLKANGNKSIIRGKQPIDENEYLTDAISREAVSFIDRHKDQPFFLYVPFNAVHQPQQAPQKYLDRFPNESDPKRKYLLAMLSAEDDGIGRILDTLRKNNLEEDTLVIFFSDNGGPTAGNGSRNTPLSGFKGQVWEGGIREPFMAQWKNHIPPGKTIDQPVISLDILPTAAHVAGAKVPSDRVIDGVDLMPLMTGKSDATPHKDLYWRFGPQAAIRSGNYKLVMFKNQPDKLFDLSTDVAEKHDQSATKPEIAKELKKKYESWNSQLMSPRWNNKAKFEEGVQADAEQMSRQGRRAARRGRQGSPASQPED